MDSGKNLTCDWCNEAFERPHERGPSPKFCSDAHRQAAHRAKKTRLATADVLAGINIPNPMADVMAGINIPNPLADVLRDFHASSTIADDPAREHGAIVLLVALFMVLYQAQLNAVAQGVVLATTRSLWTLWVLHSTIENGSPLGEAIIRAVDMLVFQLMFGSRAQGAASETD